jgi:hypothetical protein
LTLSWVEIFVAFGVSHLVGDYLLQTDWQARHKRSGLSRNDAVARRALFSHVLTYTVAFLPPVLIIASGPLQVVWILALIAVPHLIQDDGRLLAAYMTRVKRIDPQSNLTVSILVDQTFHLLALLGLALLVGS